MSQNDYASLGFIPDKPTKEVTPPNYRDLGFIPDATAQQQPAKPESNSMLRLFGEGLASGAISMGDLLQMYSHHLPGSYAARYAAGIPHEMGKPWSEDIKGGLKEYAGVNLDTEPQTPMENIVRHAGEFAGGMATPIGPLGAVTKGGVKVAQAATKYLPQAAKVVSGLVGAGEKAAIGSGIGATSGVAQEMGVNPLVADIGASIGAPALAKSIVGGAKKSATAISPALRQKMAEKEAGAILSEATEEIPQAHEAINVPKALQQFEKQKTAEEAGLSVRENLLNQIKKLKEERSQVTEPIYEKLYSINKPIHPENASQYIKDMLSNQKVTGKRRQVLVEYSKELGLMPNNKRYMSELGVRPEKGIEPGKLDSITKDINDHMAKASGENANELKRILGGLKKAIGEDIKMVPEGRGYKEKYASLSEPISAIEDHPKLGKIVEKDRYGKFFTQEEAKILDPFLKSKQYALDLKGKLGGGKKSKDDLEAVQSYINNKILTDLVSEEGKVNLRKLQGWKESNKGAFELYPHLETKLKNAANAQNLVNQIELKAKQMPLINIHNTFPVKTMKWMTRHIIVGEKILNILDNVSNKEVLRTETLQKALNDPKFAEGLMTPFKNKKKIESWADYVEHHYPSLTHYGKAIASQNVNK